MTLSDYNYSEWFVKNKAATASITYEEIAIVINGEISFSRSYTYFKIWR